MYSNVAVTLNPSSVALWNSPVSISFLTAKIVSVASFVFPVITIVIFAFILKQFFEFTGRQLFFDPLCIIDQSPTAKVHK